jgi:hypothetical protein
MPAFLPLASEDYRRPFTPPKAQGVKGASPKAALPRATDPNNGREPAPPLVTVGMGWNTHGTPKDVPPDRPKKTEGVEPHPIIPCVYNDELL